MATIRAIFTGIGTSRSTMNQTQSNTIEPNLTDPMRKSIFTRVRLPVFVVLGLLSTVWLAQVIWAGGMKDRYVPRGFKEIVPDRLYSSGQISRWLIDDVIQEHKIRVIIYFNHNDEKKNRHREKELDVAWNYRIAYSELPMPAHGMGDIHRYAEALAAIHHHHQLDRPILMHDESGNRAISIAVAFYRLLIQKQKTENVVRELLAEGWPVEDRPMLRTYLNDHLPILIEKLITMKVLKDPPAEIPVFVF